MSLSVFKGSEANAKFENDFFREFASNLSKLFDEHGYNGILLGHPESKDNKYFMPDCLLITKNVALIIDFKNYDNMEVYLPKEDSFDKQNWATNNKDVIVKGGTSVNPFAQMVKQTNWLKTIIVDNVNSNFSATGACILFHGDVRINGKIPGRYQRWFSIANIYDYLDIIDSAVDIRSNEQINDLESLRERFIAQKYTQIVPVDLSKYDELAGANKIKNEALAAQNEADSKLRRAERKYREAQESGAKLEIIRRELENAKAEAKKTEQAANELIKEFDEKKHKLDLAWADTKTAEEKRKEAEANVESEKEKTKQAKIKAIQREKDHKRSELFEKIRIGIIICAIIISVSLIIWLVAKADNDKNHEIEVAEQERTAKILSGEICMSISEVKDYIEKDGVCVEFIPLYIPQTEGGYKYIQMWDKKDGDFLVYISNSKYNTLTRETAQEYRNKAIQVRGKIVNYTDKNGKTTPEIEVFSKDRIDVKD